METPTADLSTIEAFKQRAKNFWIQWNNLNAQSGTVDRRSPALQKEYDDLLQRGSTIRTSVETATGLIDKATSAYRSAKGWVVDIFGLDGVPQLGLIPILIPAAVIATSLAAMGKWLKDVYEFNRKMEEIAKLEAKGIDPVTASKIIERVSPSGINLNAAIGLPVLLIGGLLVFNMFRKK